MGRDRDDLALFDSERFAVKAVLIWTALLFCALSSSSALAQTVKPIEYGMIVEAMFTNEHSEHHYAFSGSEDDNVAIQLKQLPLKPWYEQNELLVTVYNAQGEVRAQGGDWTSEIFLRLRANDTYLITITRGDTERPNIDGFEFRLSEIPMLEVGTSVCNSISTDDYIQHYIVTEQAHLLFGYALRYGFGFLPEVNIEVANRPVNSGLGYDYRAYFVGGAEFTSAELSISTISGRGRISVGRYGDYAQTHGPFTILYTVTLSYDNRVDIQEGEEQPLREVALSPRCLKTYY